MTQNLSNLQGQVVEIKGKSDSDGKCWEIKRATLLKAGWSNPASADLDS